MNKINKEIILKYLRRCLPSHKIEDKIRYLNFRCPFCGDSKKSKKKQRGNVYLETETPMFKCFNCDLSFNIYTFFKELDYDVYISFKKETILNRNNIEKIDYTKKKKEETKICMNFLTYIKKFKIKNFIKPKQYLIGRGIELTDYILNNLYYSDELEVIYKNFFPEKSTIYGSGIFIPTYNFTGNVNGFQIRLLNNNSDFRYVTLKLIEGNMIFNLPNLKPKNHIYINEGFFDGQFINNSLNTNLPGIKILADKISSKIEKDKITIILDNERSDEIIKLMDKLIEDRYNIFIWPNNIKFNDINDLYMGNFKNKKDKLMEFINNNTFNTIKAKIKFNNWRNNG